jgi:PBSX family phage terminase large subunit
VPTIQLPTSGRHYDSLVEAIDPQFRLHIWDGSVRTGKSVISVLAWLRHIVAGPPGDLLMIGWTIGTLRRNIIAPYLEDLVPVEYHMTSDTPHIMVGKRKIYVAGASDIRAEARIRGMTLSGVYGDEVSVWSEGMFEQAIARMSVPGAKGFFTTNPDGPNHWLKVKYIDRGESGELPYLRRHHFTLADNPHLTPDVIQMYESLYTGLWRQRFILGEWAMAEGAIFGESWDPERLVYSGPRWGEEDEHFPWEQWENSLGVDVGFTKPTSAVLVAVRHRVIVPAEYRRTGMTDQEASEEIRRWLPIARQDLRKVVYDRAAPSFGEQLYRDLWPSVERSDSRDVKARIRMIESLMRLGMLMIHESCEDLIRELPGYRWDPKAQERGVDEPLKEDDHSIDAMGYALKATEDTWGTLARNWEREPPKKLDMFARMAKARREGRTLENRVPTGGAPIGP